MSLKAKSRQSIDTSAGTEWTQQALSRRAAIRAEHATRGTSGRSCRLRDHPAGLPLGIEGAAHEVGNVDLGRVGGARAGVACKTHPQIEISREGGLRDVDPRDLVEVDAGVDD